MKPLKQKIFWSAKLLLGIGLLGWVLWRINWLDFSNSFREISVPVFLFLLLGSVTDRAMMGYKWNLLLRANGLQIPTLRIISLYVVSNLLGAFTPGNLGADAYRVVALSSYGKNSTVLSTILLERGVGMLVLLLFVIASLPFSSKLLGGGGPLILFIALVSILLILLILFLPLYPPLCRTIDRIIINRNGRLLLKFHQFFLVFAEQQKNWRILLLFFMWTIIETSLSVSLTYLAAKTAGLEVSMAFIFSFMPAVIFLLRLPISIQGLGVQEGLFVYTLSLAGNSIAQGVLASLVWRMMDVFAVYIPGGLIFMFSSSINSQSINAPESIPDD